MTIVSRLTLLLALILSVNIQAQVANSCDISRYTPVWTASEDFMSAYGPNETKKVTNFYPAKMKPHLQKALAWIKSKSAGAVGSKKAEYYNYFYPGYPSSDATAANHWFVSTGMISNYNLLIRNNGLVCRQGSLVTMDGPAWINIRFNTLVNAMERPISRNVDGKLVPLLFKTRPLYAVPVIKRSEGRVDYYQYPGPPPVTTVNWAKWLFVDAFIIRNSDKPLFLPVSRREYLETFILYMNDAYKTRREEITKLTVVKKPEEIDAEHKQRIEEIRRLTEQGAYGYSKDNLEHRLRVADEHFRKRREDEANKINDLTKDIDAQYRVSTEILQDYLRATNAADLGKPVQGGLGDLLIYPYFDTVSIRKLIEKVESDPRKEDWGNTTELCTINKDYFNPKLAPDVPQVISVEIVNLEGNHKNLDAIVENINRDFDFKGLEALFTGAAQSQAVVQQKQQTKSGGNKFLPKADTLKTLVPALAPVKEQQGMNTYTQMASPGFNGRPVQINYPALSPKLKQMQVLPTEADYKKYVLDLQQSIVNAMPSNGKQQLERYIANNRLNSSEQLARHGIGAWLSGYPSAALYFENKALSVNAGDGLSANNFAVHLLKSGYPEKALPILNYWLKKYPRNTLLLGNAANAYYYLGDLSRAMQLADQCVKEDSLHASANKLLAFGYHKSGDKKLCATHLQRSIKRSYDEEAISLLMQVDPGADINELLYQGRKGRREPELMQKFKLPAAIGNIAEAEAQAITIEEALASIDVTIGNIGSARRRVDMDSLVNMNLELLNQRGGISPRVLLAQAVVLQSWKHYWKDFGEHMQHLKQKLGEERKAYGTISGAIAKRYNDQISKMQTGEGEDPRVVMLEKAKCVELNQALDNYLKATAPLLNGFALRMELISRRHHSTVANWLPNWLQSEAAADFPGTQIKYLEDMRNILKLYPLLTPRDCEVFDGKAVEEKKPVNGKLSRWEDKFCNIKFGIAIGFAKAAVNCNTITIGAGELLQTEWEIKLNDDWNAIEETTVALGFGVQWRLGDKDIGGLELGASEKMYIKFGKNLKNRNWAFEPVDLGFKTEVTATAVMGESTMEVKALEVTLGSESGLNSSGYLDPLPRVLK